MRSYKQYCGVAAALDIVGSRWAFLVVRELLLGPRRFSDLLLPGLTPNVLSSRLKELAEQGIVHQQTLPPPAARKVWALTELGHELRPVVLALGAFGQQFLASPEGLTTSARWFLVSLQRRFSGRMYAKVNISLEGIPYKITVTPEGLVSADGTHDRAAIWVDSSWPALAGLLLGSRKPSEGEVRGDLGRFSQLVAALQ